MAALPFQAVSLFYSLLFCVALQELGAPSYLWIGSGLVLFGLSLRLTAIVDRDVPIAIAAMYAVGILSSYALYQIKFEQQIFLAILPGLLFVAGIVGNLLYFLSENQKLQFLNGQISEKRLTMQRIERWFPLWLVVLGNVLLIFAVTPFFWAMLHKVSGTRIFVIKNGGDVNLGHWFLYLIGNINESFMGVASLLGLTVEKGKILPTGIGKAVVFLFRVGSISLVLGAVKRYLDLRATTQRLMTAVGRAALEQARLEATSDDKNTLKAADNRRLMWQVRLRQLLRLYPSQMDRVLRTLGGKKKLGSGLTSGLLGRRSIGRRSQLPPEEITRWVRAELVEMLEDPHLYSNRLGLRYRVLRLLLKLSQYEGHELPPEIRRKVALGLAHLIRSGDATGLREGALEATLRLIEQADDRLSQEGIAGWELFAERRALQAAIYAALRENDYTSLPRMLDVFQQDNDVLRHDVNTYIKWLLRELAPQQASILRTVQRVVQEEDVSNLAPVLDELCSSLQQIEGDDADANAFRIFASEALAVCLVRALDIEAVRVRAAQVLVVCGEEYAVARAWDLLCENESEALRVALLDAFVEAGQSRVLVTRLRRELEDGKQNEQILAANLLGSLPAGEENRRGLREKIRQRGAHEDVRWTCLYALSRLADPQDLPFLERLYIDRDMPRLWAAVRYASYTCGDAQGLVTLVDLLAEGPSDEHHLYAATAEILNHALPVQGEAVCVVLNKESDKEARQEASETLVAERSPLALLGLAHILQGGDKSKALRQSVAEDLGLLGRMLHRKELGALGAEKSPAEWVAPALLHALEHDKDRLVRIRAARALGRLGLPQIEEKFKQVLTDPKENALLRQVVAQAVGELGDVAWEPFLLDLFENEKSLQVRQGVIAALDLFGTEPAFFLKALEAKNAKLKQLSLQALAHRELSEENKVFMLGFLQDKHKDVRSAAAEALGAQRYYDAIDALCHILNHENEKEKNVRRASLRALRLLANNDARREAVKTPLIANFNEDPDHLVIQDCAFTLVRVLGDDAESLLVNAIEQRKKNNAWQKGFAGIVRALGEIQTQTAGPLLFESLQREWRSDHLHLPRMIALLRPAGLAMGSQALPLLMEVVYRNDQAFSWIAAQVIAEIGDAQAVSPLAEFFDRRKELGTLEPNTEAALLVTFVRLGVWGRLPLLIETLNDLDRPVARRRALGMVSDLQLGISQMSLLLAMHPQHTPHEKLRETAVNSLGKLTGNLDAVLEALLWQANSDPRAKIREAAQASLRMINARVQRSLAKVRQGQELAPRDGQVAYKQHQIHPVFQAKRDDYEKMTLPMEADVLEIFAERERARAERRAAREAEEAAKKAAAEAATEAKAEEAAEVKAPAKKQAKKAKEEATPEAVPAVAEVIEAVVAAPTPPAPVAEVASTTAAPEVEEVIVLQTAAVEAVVAEVEITPPSPPSFEERIEAALRENDHTALVSILEANTEDADTTFWKSSLRFLAEIDTYRKKFGAGWVFIPGDVEGSAAKWPLFLQQAPVTLAAFKDFCRAQKHSMPERGTNLQANDPVVGISSIDAEAYAQSLKVHIPTAEQLKRASLGVVTDFGGHHSEWTLPGISEWTSTAHPRRQALLQAFNVLNDSTMHLQRGERTNRATFRCAYILDVQHSAVERAIAEQANRHLLLLLSWNASQHDLEIPAVVKSLFSDVMLPEAFTAADVPVPTLESKIPARPKEAKPAQPRKKKPSKKKQLSNLFAEGRWAEAFALLDASPELATSFGAIRPQLEELRQWLQAHEGHVWVTGSWRGSHNQRPFLISRALVDRQSYLALCEEKALPKPQGWPPEKAALNEAHSPVVGLSFEEARLFAQTQEGEIPSYDQLLRANRLDSLPGEFPEWTSSSVRGNRRLMKCFSTNEHDRRTLRRDDNQSLVGFRTVRVLEPKAIPTLLLEMSASLPAVADVEQLPRWLASSLSQYTDVA